MSKYNKLNRFKDQPLKVGNAPLKKQQHFWWHNVVIVGWFIGLFWIFYFLPVTDMSVKTMLRYLVFFALIGLVIPYKWYARVLKMGRMEIRLFSIAGLGPFLTGSLLAINFTFSSNLTLRETTITGIKEIGTPESREVIITLDDSVLQDHEKFRTFDVSSEITDLRYGNKTITYLVADGAFGYKVLYSKTIH